MTVHPRPTASCKPACGTESATVERPATDPLGANTRAHSAPEVLGRIARLHGALAEEFEHLAKHPGNRLDVLPGTSGMDSVSSAPQFSTKLLSVSDLADLFGVNEKTVRTWRDEGRLPDPVQVGATIRWHPAEFDAWLRGGCR